MTEPPPKRLVWIASSRRDMQALPKGVRRAFGVALFAAQVGVTPTTAKPLKGFGSAGVLELMEDSKGGTYRAAYTVRYATAVLSAARVSEEVEARHRNAAAGRRAYQGAAEDRRGGA